MSCAHPLPALDLGLKTNKDGEIVRDIKLLDMKHRFFGYGLEELKERFGDSLLLLPCGKCFSCALDYSKEWSARILLEAQCHQFSCFITLTYNDHYCPDKLSKRDVQLFLKRLRKEVGPIRYFLCGEYGEKSEKQTGFGRPHYHAIIFGCSFDDKIVLSKSKSGNYIYRSPTLERLWPFGISSIGELTPESAQYCAKYSLKRKVSSINRGEFVLMSRRPGLGASCYDKEIWRTDRLYLKGKNYKIPRYFNKIAERDNCQEQAIAKILRSERGKTYKSKKFLYGLDREEESLKRENEIKIYNNALKVRF